MTQTNASSTGTIYECTPREIRQFVVDCITPGVDLVPFIKGPPGVGKSSIVADIAREFNLELKDHRLSTSGPEDLNGLPDFQNGRAVFKPFNELFPIEGDELPKGKDGWLLFLDEFNSASKAVQAACYKLILDRAVGQHKLHERVVIVLAGNRAMDGAIVNELGTAMKSRVITLNMKVDFNEWYEDVALKQNYNDRIKAWLNFNNDALMDFDPKIHRNEDTFNCPRTIEFLNRLVKGKEVTDKKIKLYCGTISTGHAVAFVQFCKVIASMVTVDRIMADPEGVKVPDEVEVRWAVITHMVSKTDDKNFDKMRTYADRFDISFRILFYRSLLVQKPQVRQHPDFGRALAQMSKYLNEDDYPAKKAA